MHLIESNRALRALAPLVAAGALVVPSQAHAWGYLDGSAYSGYAGCSRIEWPSDPTYGLSVLTIPLGHLVSMADAVADVSDRINKVGGTWLDVNLGVSYSTSATYEEAMANGVSEFNMYDLAPFAGIGVAGIGIAEIDSVTCEISAADVTLNDTAWVTVGDHDDPCGSWIEALLGLCEEIDFPWTFEVPEDEGEDYWDVTGCVGQLEFGTGCGGESYPAYARPVLLHEAMHTFGFAHEATDHAVMNYGSVPFTNRSEPKMIEPQPDDRDGLRTAYPGSATEVDVATVNTFVDRTDSVNGAGISKRLCKPSKGPGGWSPSKFDEYCGVTGGGAPGSTEVCPGDRIYARYSIFNHSQIDLDVDQEMWMSTNDFLNTTAGADKQSPDVRTLTVGGETTYRTGQTFEVPADVSYGTTYHVIIRSRYANALAEALEDMQESTQNNWTPVRGTLTVKAAGDC